MRSPDEPSSVTLNGTPLRHPEIRTSSENGYVVLWYEASVPLEPNDNYFTVRVVTGEGIASEEVFSVSRNLESKMWVAAIGISDYASSAVIPLSYADDDATGIRDYYRDILGIDDDHLFLLTDEQATVTSIRKLLGDQLYRLADEADTVIIHYAGHGAVEADSGSPDGLAKYLLPHNGEPNALYSSALPVEEITRILRRLRAGRVVFLVDTCFSGAAGGRTLFDPGRRSHVSDDFLQKIAEAGEGRVVFAASRADQVAKEKDELRHGVFTYYVLEGLRGKADTNGDGEITIDELYPYVRDRVEATTGGSQNPVLKSEYTGRVVLGRVQE